MKKILREITTDKGETSSARVINIGGFLVGTTLLMYHGIWLDTLSYDVFGVYMAYCAGVYTGGKYLDRRYGNVADTDRYNERYEEPSYHGSTRGVDNPDV